MDAVVISASGLMALPDGEMLHDRCNIFVSQLARAKAQTRRAGLTSQVGFHLALCGGQDCGINIAELPGARGVDGDTPASQDVEQDGRHRNEFVH